MSQVSEEIKAKRKQHRQDHYTDADKALNGQGQMARRAARSEAYSNQGNEGASDFNFDQYGKGHISNQEVKHLRNSGQSREDIMSAVQANGGEVGTRAQKRFDKWGAAKEKAEVVKENPVNPTPEPVNTTQPAGPPTPYKPPTNTAEVSSGGTSQTVTQDNDQTSTVNGNDNYVYQNQDNSVRNYGGDSRVFNYQGSGDATKDTPGTAGTLGGFFAPDDSHSANAARLDRQSTQNRDLQKAYQNTSHIAQGAISRAGQNAYTDPAALDQRIANREQYNNAKSDVMRAQLFGDMGNFQASPWKDAKPQEEVEMPDYEEMYDKYSKF
tara:strand:+ start:1469 stop:2443 length:975 start_codon:yes stop_codon:yes gene_type:complete